MKLLLVRIITLLSFLLIISACSSSTSADSNDDGLEVMAVLADNTGSTDLRLVEINVEFCYEDDECERVTRNGNFTLPADSPTRLELGISQPGKTATGVVATFEVAEGLGEIEVMRGTAIEDGFFLDFTGEESLYTETVGEGDVLRIEVGQTPE